jgi:hypothetical protein
MRSLPLLLLVCLGLLLTGCITDGESRAKPAEVPWPEADAPAELHRLADDLGSYQAAVNRLPADLRALDGSGLTTGGPYAVHGYVYHPSGIGVLRDGWRVMLADDQVRIAGRVWCIVRPPVRVGGAPSLLVVSVPVIELRDAAENAGIGR